MLVLYIVGGALLYIVAGSAVVSKVMDINLVDGAPDEKEALAFLTLLWPLTALGTGLHALITSGKVNFIGRATKYLGHASVKAWYGTGKVLFFPFLAGHKLTQKKKPDALPKATVERG